MHFALHGRIGKDTSIACVYCIFRHLKLELLTQFPASNDEKNPESSGRQTGEARHKVRNDTRCPSSSKIVISLDKRNGESLMYIKKKYVLV